MRMTKRRSKKKINKTSSQNLSINATKFSKANMIFVQPLKFYVGKHIWLLATMQIREVNILQITHINYIYAYRYMLIALLEYMRIRHMPKINTCMY